MSLIKPNKLEIAMNGERVSFDIFPAKGKMYGRMLKVAIIQDKMIQKDANGNPIFLEDGSAKVDVTGISEQDMEYMYSTALEILKTANELLGEAKRPLDELENLASVKMGSIIAAQLKANYQVD